MGRAVWSLATIHECRTQEYHIEGVPRVVSKKCVREMEESLAICHGYKDVDSLDVYDRAEAMEYLDEWAAQVKVGLCKQLYRSQMMMAWLTCMSTFLYVHSDYVDHKELIDMMAECLPRLLEVLAYYTTHADIKTRHEVCRAVVNVLLTMSTEEKSNNTWQPEEESYNTWQPAPDTRVHADKVIWDYQLQLMYDQEGWRVAFNNPVFYDSDYDDDYGDELSDVENLGKWVQAGMFLPFCPCQCSACRGRLSS